MNDQLNNNDQGQRRRLQCQPVVVRLPGKGEDRVMVRIIWLKFIYLSTNRRHTESVL